MSRKEIITTVLNGNPRNGWVIFRHNRLRWVFMTFLILIFTVVTIGSSLVFFWEYVSGGALSEISTEEKVYGSIMLFIGFISLIYLIGKLKVLFYMKSNMLVFTNDSVVLSWNGKVRDFLYSDISEPFFHFRTGRYSYYYNSYIDFKSVSTGKHLDIGYREDYKAIQEIYRILQNKIA